MFKNFKNIAVIGTQWGDEGKGKIVDLLSEDADYVVRFQGGDNAGHTVNFDGIRIALHSIPSGIIHENAINVLGNGVVLNPSRLLEEIAHLKSLSLMRGKLRISERAHVITSHHIEMDKNSSLSLKIGTTGHGIGYTYLDKVGRKGTRIIDLLEQGNEEIKKLKEFICDTRVLLQDAIDKGKRILFEGAQGTMLDIDFGTYPFVTSSTTTLGGIFSGTGVRVRDLFVLGVAKGYITRVGNGPFPTELKGEMGDFLRERGNEFGATTGRPRRCGWLDLVALKYAASINGLDGLALLKLDVLSGFEEVKVAVAYDVDGKYIMRFPSSTNILKKIDPVYETFPGWGDISKIDTYEALPKEVKDYISFIEDFTKVKVMLVGNGPDRKNRLYNKKS
ncbi:MAG: adenylosuccinate synthetase [Thermotogae bacterium]|nr:adenylosuccinate synthetase [Thermotogota bacterium]